MRDSELVPRRPKTLSRPRLLRDDGPVAIDVRPREVVTASELWALLREHYGTVIAVALVTTAVVLGATLLASMQFRSSGRLYLGDLTAPLRSANTTSEQIELSDSGQGDVASEIEIITSRGLVTRAILKSGLNVGLLPAEQKAPRYASWLFSRRDPALLDRGVRELRAVDTDIGPEARDPVRYRVRFESANDYVLSSGERVVAKGRLGEPLRAEGTTLTLVSGNEGAPRAGAAYDLTITPLVDVLGRVGKHLDVSTPKAATSLDPAKVVILSFTDGSPRLAAGFLSALMQVYLEERRSWKAEDAKLAEEFVTHQLAGIRSSLDELENKLASYRTNHREVVLDDEAKAMIEQVGKYEEQRVTARLQVAALTDIKKTLANPDPPLGAYLLGETGDPVLQGLADSLSEARQKLTDLDTRYNAASPELKQQRAQVNAQLEAIRNYVSSRLNRARENHSAISGIISQFESKLRSVPGAELGLTQLSRESDVYRRLYSYLLERQQEMAIVKASNVSKNRVLDAPAPVFREDSPKLLLRLASLPVGLLLGVLVVVARALLRDTFQSEVEVKHSLGTLPVFATVPHKHKKLRASTQGARTFALPFEPPEAAFEEAFRTLRANLSYFHAHEPPRVVVVTSPAHGDGKTTTALSLAALVAADGRRALVVDADLRHPSHCRGHDEPSLETVLRGECDWRDAVHRIATLYGEFDAIGASEGTLPELLASDTMQAFLSEARATYDLVVLDAPSFPLYADALVLTRSADCVLSVIRLGRTPRRETATHLERLSLVTGMQAVVVNDAAHASSTRRAATGPHFPTTTTAPARSIPLTRRRVAGISALLLGLLLGGAFAAQHTTASLREEASSWR